LTASRVITYVCDDTNCHDEVETVTLMGEDRAVLVIGATGFVGRRVVRELTAAGLPVRSLVRDPTRAGDLAGERVEVVRGDMLDAHTVSAAAQQVRAVIVCVHTVSPQPARQAGQDFIDVEEAGVGNIVAACRANAVARVLYVTSIGVAADARSSWTRGRARIENLLFTSGLDVTVLRPGMIRRPRRRRVRPGRTWRAAPGRGADEQRLSAVPHGRSRRCGPPARRTDR